MQKNSSSWYSNLILNLYLVYELNDGLYYPCNNFTLKNCLFGTVKLTKNIIKSNFLKMVWRQHLIELDRNVVIFSVDNSSSSHADRQ